MHVQTTQDLFALRLGDSHSSACFMARHIPSLVSAAANKNVRKVLNQYLDVVRDNADRTEVVLSAGTEPTTGCNPKAVPAMVDELFDMIDRIQEPLLVDVAIVLSSNEIGSFEAHRLRLLADVAGMMGQDRTKDALQESSERLRAICDQFGEIMQDENLAKRPN